MKIAILGTGLMGSGLTEGLIKAGHETIVYDITAAKTEALVALGSKAMPTAADAISAADATIMVVPDGSAVRNLLLNEATKAVLKGKKILNAGTTTPAEIEEFEQEVNLLGGSFAEMSMSVGSEQLRERQGSFLLACTTEMESFWTAILKSIGEEVLYVGKVGNASKAESPLIFGSMLMTLTVAYSAAVALKLNIPQSVISQQLSMLSHGAEYFLPSMFARDYSQVSASVDNFKSVSETAISTVKSLGMPTKALEGVLELFEVAVQRGYGSIDGSSILEVLLEPNK